MPHIFSDLVWHHFDKGQLKMQITEPSNEAETKREVIHWHIDRSVISPSCLPTNWTPSIRLSTGHLRGSSAEKTSLLPTLVVSILRTRFPIPTTRTSCIYRGTHTVAWKKRLYRKDNVIEKQLLVCDNANRLGDVWILLLPLSEWQ